MPLPPDHLPRLDPPLRIPKIPVRNHTDPDQITSTTSHTTPAYQSRPPAPDGRLSTDRPSSSSTSGSRSLPSVTTSPSDDGTGSTKSSTKKKKKGVLGRLTLKEPSTAAWESYAKQQKAQTTTRGASLTNLPAKKLPADVPKVNSKWDGMPGVAHSKRGSSSSSSQMGAVSPATSYDFPRPTPKSLGPSKPASRRRGRSRGQSNASKGDEDTARPSRVDHERQEARSSFDSSIRIVPDVNDDAMDPGLDARDFGTMSEMSLFWPPSYSAGGVQQAVAGASEAEQLFVGGVSTKHAPTQSQSSDMPMTRISGTSSPNMPQTPEDDEEIPDHSKLTSKFTSHGGHDRPSSVEPNASWPLNRKAVSGRSSVSDSAASTRPATSRRPSVEVLLAQRASSGNFESFYQLDGSAVAHQEQPSAAESQKQLGTAGSFSRLTKSSSTSPAPRSPVATPRLASSAPRSISSIEERHSTSTWYSSDGEGEDLDKFDAMRRRARVAASPRQSTSRPRQELSRPRSPESGASSGISSPSLPRSHLSPAPSVRSFSRPLPRATPKSTSENKSKSTPPMGTISIIRNNQPVYRSSSGANNNYVHSTSLHVPPRFQPGRVMIKDSDLDTIAESETNSSRRASRMTISSDRDEASAVEEADPRPIPSKLFVAGTPKVSEFSSLRTSMSFTDSEPDNDDTDADVEDSADSGEETEIEPPNHRASTDEHDLYRLRTPTLHLKSEDKDDAVSIAESRHSVASNMSEQWYLSPRERLGLGGFIRRSTRDTPWREEELSPSHPAETIIVPPDIPRGPSPNPMSGGGGTDYAEGLRAQTSRNFFSDEFGSRADKYGAAGGLKKNFLGVLKKGRVR